MANSTDPTLAELWTEFPSWECWEGISGLVYARKLLTSPPVVFRAESTTDLRDQIRGYLGRQP